MFKSSFTPRQYPASIYKIALTSIILSFRPRIYSFRKG